MKKRLFISSILMTLVLLVAITTATFAWYSAASSVTMSNETANISTSAGDIELSGLSVVAAWGDSTAEASLGHLVETDSQGNVKAFNNQGHLVTVSKKSGSVDNVLMTLTLTTATADASSYQGTYYLYVYTTTTTNSSPDAVSRLRLSTAEATKWTDEQSISGSETSKYIKIRFDINAAGKLVKYVDGSTGDVVATNNATGISWTFYVSLNGQPSSEIADQYGSNGANVDQTLVGTLVCSQKNPNDED